MECQVEKNVHFRHLLFAFNQGSKAAKAARGICAVYGENAIPERTACYWYAKFKNGNFDLKDTPRSGRPAELDEGRLNQLVHENSHQTTRELAEKMECFHTAIEKHLHSMGKVQKCGAWVPHVLSDNNKNHQATTSAGLLARHRSTHGHKQQFLFAIVTGDEKWCLYINMKQRKEWLSSCKQATPRVKQDLHPRKTMLCVWWDWEGIIHFELLERNQTVTAELYVQQMERLKLAIQEKRPNQQHVLLLHDKRKPFRTMAGKCCHTCHTYQVWQRQISTSFNLFPMLCADFRSIHAELKAWLDEFFKSKPNDFYRRGIENLVERWEEVVNNNENTLLIK